MKKLLLVLITLVLSLGGVTARAEVGIALEFEPHPYQLQMKITISDPQVKRIAWFAPGQRERRASGMKWQSISASNLNALKKRVDGDWVLQIDREEGEAVYHFTMDFSGLNDERFGEITITSPAPGEQVTTVRPRIEWQTKKPFPQTLEAPSTATILNYVMGRP